MVGDGDDGERRLMGMGMSADGDVWGSGQILVPMQLSTGEVRGLIEPPATLSVPK